MAELRDVYPVTIRGPLSTNRSRLSTFARIFVHENRLYVAESRNKGATVTTVSSYPLPDAELIQRAGKAGRWGDWSWSGCGCANSWRRHTIEELVALDSTPAAAEPEPVAVPPVTGSNPYDWPTDTAI